MRFFIKKTSALFEHGWGNGYVLLNKGHPMYGKSCDKINNHVTVHGGLTFSQRVSDSMVKAWPELNEKDIGKWLVGFDTCHAYDDIHKWPEEAVYNETRNLFRQLEDLQINQTTIEDIKIIEL